VTVWSIGAGIAVWPGPLDHPVPHGLEWLPTVGLLLLLAAFVSVLVTRSDE
jgi:hypothetical protein